VEVGPDWSEGRLSAASQEGVRRKAAANARGMQGYAAGAVSFGTHEEAGEPCAQAARGFPRLRECRNLAPESQPIGGGDR
jgi:hypothetical protein